MPITSDGAAPPPSGEGLRVALSAVWRLLGGARRDAALPLPPRAAAMVREQQAGAEVLIGLVQVAAIATFAVLYAAARGANPPPAGTVEPVPLALGLYGVFTGARLWLALRRRMTAPILAASAVVDIAVLMLTIWSFSLQYMASAAVAVKAPTLMYAFILIALRALRFEAFYVLLAGGAAVLGSAALTGYALLLDEPPARVTRSLLDYASSPAVLPGAEFDKAASMAVVTAVLALVVARGRALLVDATREGVASAELSRFFAPEVAARIRGGGGVVVGMAERRQAAILVTDLRGFTALSRDLPPFELLALLGEYQRRVVGAIRRNGGSIDKYMGDGVLASFGAVNPGGAYAADALRAVEDVAAEIAVWNAGRHGQPPIGVGAAVACGEILFGAVGDAERLEYTLIGDPVNLAAKLEKHNKVEGSAALAERAAHDLAVAQGYRPRAAVEKRAGRAVAGVEAPLDLVVLTAPPPP